MSYSPTEKLKVEVIDHTAVITMDNPAANVWDKENLTGLKVLVENLNADKNIYALVITGEGEKFFSAGADLKQFADGERDVAEAVGGYFGEAFEALADFRGVSIAAINGWSMGGGLEVALACDIRIAEEHANMALPETGVGLLACAGGCNRLPWLIGEGWAKRMILCGERVNAETAERIGLVQEVVPKGTAKDKAIELAAGAAKLSPIAVTYSKELIHVARDNAMASGLPAEREKFADLFGTKDQLEGVNAFLEKRKPEWKNA